MSLELSAETWQEQGARWTGNVFVRVMQDCKTECLLDFYETAHVL
jgi:hypothetical protein